MIKYCGCKSKDGKASRYQDAKYGEGMRVHNEMAATDGKRRCRCTICGKEKEQ